MKTCIAKNISPGNGKTLNVRAFHVCVGVCVCVKLLPRALLQSEKLHRVWHFPLTSKEQGKTERLFNDFKTNETFFFFFIAFITCLRVSGVCVDVYT